MVSVCIAPSPNPAKAPGSTEALDVYDRSTIGCGICVRANAMGDGIYESMARDSGYGIDIVYTGGTSSVPVGPQLRLNNGYFGFASSGLAGAMQSILVADAGSSADDIHVEQQKTTGNTVELDQNWSAFAGTMIKLVVGAVGQSSTHPGAERGRCENCKFEAYYNNSSGSAVQEHSIDGEGNELNHGSVSVGNHLDQESTGDFANTCSMNGASSCAFALAHGYGAPACIATVQGTTPIAAACSSREEPSRSSRRGPTRPPGQRSSSATLTSGSRSDSPLGTQRFTTELNVNALTFFNDMAGKRPSGTQTAGRTVALKGLPGYYVRRRPELRRRSINIRTLFAAKGIP